MLLGFGSFKDETKWCRPNRTSEVKTGTLQLKSAITVHRCVLIFLHTVPVNTLETDASALTAVHHIFLFEAHTELPHLLQLVCSSICSARSLPSLCLPLFPCEAQQSLILHFSKKIAALRRVMELDGAKKRRRRDLLIASKNGVNVHTMPKHTGWDGVNNWCRYL